MMSSSCCLLLFSRLGWLSAAVHQELWAGEGGRRTAVENHTSGARRSGCFSNRPPGTYSGGCGPALCAGEHIRKHTNTGELCCQQTQIVSALQSKLVLLHYVSLYAGVIT